MMDKALSIIMKEFKKLREKRISERELKKAKESLKGSFILHLESTTNRMMRIAQSELYFNRIKHTDEIIKSIDAVTADNILELSNQLLDENTFIKLIIKSKDAMILSAA